MSLKDLQEKRLQLGAQIKELGQRQSDWKPEDETQWRALNEAYDANQAAMTAEQERLSKDESVQRRLAEIEAEWRSSNSERRIGLDEVNRRTAAPERKLIGESRAYDLAVQAAARSANFLDLNDEHKEACKQIGVKFHKDGTIDVPIRSGFPYGVPAWTDRGQQTLREFRSDANMNTGAGVGAEGIPQGFMNELERKLVAFGGPRAVCRVWRTPSGNAVPWPTIDDTGNSGALLAEETSIGDTLAATTAAVTFNAYKMSSKPIKMSAELLEDNAIGLGELVGSLLGERLGRIVGTYSTTGTGSSQPKGIVTCATAGVTAASATAIASDEVVNLVHQVDPAYRTMDCGFMMNDGILLYVRKLKDGQGQYLWQPGISAGVPDRLFGYPVTINQHMQSTVATATKTIIFGDFSKFVIREVGSVRFYRLEELYRATDQTGFVAFMRMDSDCIQTAAIKYLLQA